ncbi:MAG TPA: YqjK-like family protein [Rhodocyclaceae bacterium]|jgi:hypothetical protein|nr:YqjK-like family protein [Rhodocyclaceae bacterium]
MEIELALKKQRLQMRSAALRSSFAGHALALQPVCNLADRGRIALHWLRRHPALPVAGLVALLVARPRAILRLAQRGWFVWQALRKLRNFLPTK